MKLLKQKKVKNGILEITQPSRDIKILCWTVDQKLVKSKVFIFPLMSSSKSKKQVDHYLNQEWKKWYNLLSKFGYLVEDDSMDNL